ncbi:unnamed protein product [Malus baccata var. baccata]
MKSKQVKLTEPDQSSGWINSTIRRPSVRKMNHPNNHANDIANPDDNANLDEIVENHHTPLWKYVKKLEKVGKKGGGNAEFKCNYCQKTYKGSYSRVGFHLLKMAGNGVAPCSKVTDENLAEMKKLIRECEYKLKSSAPKNVSLPNTGSFCYDQPEVNLDPKKRKGTSRPLSKAFNKEGRDQCDAEVARMFYTGGLSFNLARNPHYRNSYVQASTLPGFASTLVILRRFKEVKEEDDLVKAMTVKQKILDEYFWEKIDYILFFTAPICEVIRMADTDKPCLHLVYEWWDAMIEKQLFDAVYRILLERWTKSSTPLHFLAHSLNPRYYSSEWLQEVPSRVAPHRDVELTTERKKCFERYFSNEEIRRSINVEYASFSMCLNDFGAIDSMNDRFHLEPVMWWIVHGASTPSLQSIALKLLGQPCSSSCCERNWSTYSFIHSLRRNKITPQRAEDLVFVHNNLRLLSRNSATYKEGISQLWDVGGDGFENLGEESVGMLDIANLSLDEPSLETTLITGGDIMNVEVE